MEHRPGGVRICLFFGKIMKFKQNIRFLTVYHWDKQVIDFFGNYRHLNKRVRKTTGELILYNDDVIFNEWHL